MKKIIGAIICMITLLTRFCTFPAGELPVNYCNVFEEQVPPFLWRGTNMKLETIEGKLKYTADRINVAGDRYGIDAGNYSVYEATDGVWGYGYPADLFEKLATSFFEVTATELRAAAVIDEVFYDAAEEIYYVHPTFSSWGGSPVWSVVGYVVNTDKTYAVYLRSYDAGCPIDDMDAFLEQWRQSHDGEEYGGEFIKFGDTYYRVEKYACVIVSYDTENVRYLSHEIYESLPDVPDMITPDTRARVGA